MGTNLQPGANGAPGEEDKHADNCGNDGNQGVKGSAAVRINVAERTVEIDTLFRAV